MKLETAKAIIEAAHDTGFEMDIREEYSGRNMYGKTTTAITFQDQGELLQATVLAGRQIARDDEFDNFIEDLKFKFDNMGRDSSIAY